MADAERYPTVDQSPVDNLEERLSRFNRVEFPAFMVGGPQINTKGDINVKLVIPFDRREVLLELVNAMGVPINVVFERWERG